MKACMFRSDFPLKLNFTICAHIIYRSWQRIYKYQKENDILFDW